MIGELFYVFRPSGEPVPPRLPLEVAPPAELRFRERFVRMRCRNVVLHCEVVEQWVLWMPVAGGGIAPIDFDVVVFGIFADPDTCAGAGVAAEVDALASRAVLGEHGDRVAAAVFWRIFIPNGVPAAWIEEWFPAYAAHVRQTFARQEGPCVAPDAVPAPESP